MKKIKISRIYQIYAGQQLEVPDVAMAAVWCPRCQISLMPDLQCHSIELWGSKERRIRKRYTINIHTTHKLYPYLIIYFIY